MTPQEEIPAIEQLKRWNATLIKMHDDRVLDSKKKEHAARRSAFSAGIFGLLIPFVLYLSLDSKVFDEKLDVFIEENKWASFLMIGVFTGCWKGMHYLAVQRHDPERKKK